MRGAHAEALSPKQCLFGDPAQRHGQGHFPQLCRDGLLSPRGSEERRLCSVRNRHVVGRF